MPAHFENTCPYPFSYCSPSAKDYLTSASITPNGSCSSPNTHADNPASYFELDLITHCLVSSPLRVTIPSPSPPPSDDQPMQGTDSLLLCALPKTEPELRTWSVFQERHRPPFDAFYDVTTTIEAVISFLHFRIFTAIVK
ncbi:hypothetical protein GCK32_019000 [Trichostrongylus colubriformis]|uniref:Uncharacterized protein n=1 Tax=Trichostrongylus colubriformis TaxID=6319 RepID=A0AAN8INJ0_TRICO